LFGLLASTRLTIQIAANRIIGRANRNRKLEANFLAYTHSGENSGRAAEFAIGANLGVERVIGNILQDEKLLGFDIRLEPEFGGEQIIRGGRFLITAQIK
jgi:aminopeptidase